MQKNLIIEVVPVNDSDDYQVVKFTGEFDKAGHSEVREEIDSIVKAFDLKFLVFDFSGLKFINSEGIGYLMEIHSFLSGKDKTLIIIGAASNVKDVFETIGLNEIIPVHESLKAFLSSK